MGQSLKSLNNMVDLKGSLAFVLVAIFFSVGQCQRIRPDASGRAADNTECWYPNYYCSFTPDNIAGSSSFGEDKATAKDCLDACAGVTDCAHFTWIKMRGVAKCYLLKKCDNLQNDGPNYRIYDDHCLNRDPAMCISGPKNCGARATMTNCEAPSPLPDQKLIEWQCEDNTYGNLVNLYESSVDLVPGTRCLQTCDSWQAKRTVDIVPPRAYIFSECQFDGQWGEVKPYDRYDNGNPTELEFPAAPSGGYPKPDVRDALSCDCQHLVLLFPTDGSGTQHAYNPRSEPGADLECDEEIENEAIDVEGQVTIKSYNICRFFCDNYLVATISCQDGAWKGKIEDGFWCYTKPKVDDRECGLMDWKCGRGVEE